MSPKVQKLQMSFLTLLDYFNEGNEERHDDAAESIYLAQTDIPSFLIQDTLVPNICGSTGKKTYIERISGGGASRYYFSMSL